MMNTFENHLHNTESRWFAIYARYRCEKIVNGHLQSKLIHSYLPLKKVVRQYGKQKKKLALPLISNYVFVKITRGEYVRVLETNHVLNFVKFSKNLISIPEEEINLMKRVVGDQDVQLTAVSQELVKGNWVEIISGSLTGLKGVLEDFKGKKIICVRLRTIAYTLKIQLDKQMVRKINEPSWEAQNSY